MRAIHGVWLLIGTLGALLCMAVLAATFAPGTAMEQGFRLVISKQVSKQVGRAVDAFDERFLAERANAMQGKLGQQAQALREQIKRRLPPLIDEQVQRMQDPNCTCRRVLKERLNAIELQMSKLPAFIQNTYAQAVQHLLAEVRLFAGINATSFVLVMLAGFLGLRGKMAPDTGRLLAIATCLLLVATGIAAYLYLFNQNWLEVLLFNRWMGWGYGAGLVALFVWLCDLVLNRARVTRHLISSSTDSSSVAPC